jgi:predicted amidohydrolase
LKPKKWDKAHNADKLESFFRKAARRNPDVIVATEGVLEGYVVMDAIRHSDKRKAMLDIAEPINGPCVKRFRDLARKLKTCLAFGFAERIGNDVYNTAVFIDQHGRISGKYHKTQLKEGAHASWSFNRIGKTLRAFDTPHGRAGFLICNDRWNPDIARAIVLDGAQYLMICSFGSRRKKQNVTVLARARENGVPIIEANVGVNMIVSKGEVVAYKWGCDQITVAEIDVPAPPSTRAARAAERDYLKKQGPAMQRQYKETMRGLKRKR